MSKRKQRVLRGLLWLAALSVLTAACGSSGSGRATDGPHMLYFYAKWWPVCKQMTPIVNGLADKYQGEFEIVNVDIDSSQGKTLAREHGFIGQPTFMFFDESGQKVRNLMGPQTEESLEQAIQAAMAR